MVLLKDDQECLVLASQLLDNVDLACSEPLGVQLQNAGSWVIFGGIDAAEP